MRYASLFRSRWLALFWSAGIVWTAVDFAGSQAPDSDVEANSADANSSDGDAASLKQLQALVGKLES